MSKTKLIPPDRKQCQAEIREGTFMSLGGSPHRLTRCKAKPTMIITENQPGRDGQRGSMSLCPSCWVVFQKQEGTDVTITPLRKGKATP